jgi:hypothetical protein
MWEIVDECSARHSVIATIWLLIQHTMRHQVPRATPAEIEKSPARLSFPALHRKEVPAAFHGRLAGPSGGAALLLAQAGREMRICARGQQHYPQILHYVPGHDPVLPRSRTD